MMDTELMNKIREHGEKAELVAESALKTLWGQLELAGLPSHFPVEYQTGLLNEVLRANGGQCRAASPPWYDPLICHSPNNMLPEPGVLYFDELPQVGVHGQTLQYRLVIDASEPDTYLHYQVNYILDRSDYPFKSRVTFVKDGKIVAVNMPLVIQIHGLARCSYDTAGVLNMVLALVKAAAGKDKSRMDWMDQCMG